MLRTRLSMALAMAFPLSFPVWGQDAAPSVGDAPTKSLGVVTILSGQPSSLPTQIPTTLEGVTRAQIEQTVNATDSEDAIKYFPSLLVRKRYIGDYNHAVLSSRASGTGNSARSAVYADGILLSNYLGNGATYAPRWGLVTPEEIERVDVMYGPFSAAYPGNSVGAVVDYVTRMPTKFEAHAKLSYVSQPFELYGSSDTFTAKQASASVGNRSGDWAWWLNVNHTDSEGQPQTFVTRRVVDGVTGSGGAVVTGAVLASDRTGAPIYVLGAGTQYHTEQDHLKLKLAYDVTPTLRASYTLGYWHNTSTASAQSYLRDAAGNPVYSGGINIGGLQYTSATQQLGATNFGASQDLLKHVMHGLSLKSHTQGVWDWEVAASQYDLRTDTSRAAGVALPAALNGGSGTLADQDGTGWRTLAFKGTWRPQGILGEHIVDLGAQFEDFDLRILRSNVTSDWRNGVASSVASDVRGQTRQASVYAQDTWAFAPRWKTVLGARLEQWRASDGYTAFSASSNQVYAAREESHVSPKGALSWQWKPDTLLKVSTGRAVRFPTVSELYGATSTTNSQYINDPSLRPEKSWTNELTAEQDLGSGLLRLTLFTEDVRDALYAQTVYDSTAQKNVARVQNIGRVRTRGLEAAYSGVDVFTPGLELGGSVTYADSRIKDNAGFVSAPGDTIGKYQPRVPVWRATAVASYRIDPRWTVTCALRYSGRQYNTLDNSDPNGFAYQGTSQYFTTDLRVRWKVDAHTALALGIDNLNNDRYWNFHPYPQRSYMAELKFDL